MYFPHGVEPICNHSPAAGFKLTNADKVRLELVAPWFNLSLSVLSMEKAEILLGITDRTQAIVLGMDVAHKRLLTEVCSRAGPWVYFHLGKSCRDSLFDLPNARLRRIGDLYRSRLEQSR
jgi:hypothetical protein